MCAENEVIFIYLLSSCMKILHAIYYAIVSGFEAQIGDDGGKFAFSWTCWWIESLNLFCVSKFKDFRTKFIGFWEIINRRWIHCIWSQLLSVTFTLFKISTVMVKNFQRFSKQSPPSEQFRVKSVEKIFLVSASLLFLSISIFVVVLLKYWLKIV